MSAMRLRSARLRGVLAGPNMRLVPIKTSEQQLMILRLRSDVSIDASLPPARAATRRCAGAWRSADTTLGSARSGREPPGSPRRFDEAARGNVTLAGAVRSAETHVDIERVAHGRSASRAA